MLIRMRKNKKAQNTMEYAIIIAVVVGALSGMQLYMKRGMQGNLKDGMDKIPSQVGAGGLLSSQQYEPYYMAKGEYAMQTTSSEGTASSAVNEASIDSSTTGKTQTRTGSQSMTGTDGSD